MAEQDYETKIAAFEARIVALEIKVADLETKISGQVTTSSASPNRPKMPRIPNRIGGGSFYTGKRE